MPDGETGGGSEHRHLMGKHRICPYCHYRLYDPDESMGHFLHKHGFRFEKSNGLAKWLWEGDTPWPGDGYGTEADTDA